MLLDRPMKIQQRVRDKHGLGVLRRGKALKNPSVGCKDWKRLRKEVPSVYKMSRFNSEMEGATGRGSRGL